MNHRYIILAALLPAVSGAAAQADGTLQSKEKYEYADALYLWQNAQNPAGLSRDTLSSRGVSYLELSLWKGTYHRVQDGNKQHNLQFTSERYQSIGRHLYGYGRFTFDMGRTFGRAWSDVMRSHHSNPYFSGSAVEGKYDHQNFDLAAALATLPMHGFTYGFRLDYKVGDLSRLKDPRSRSNLADYKLMPGVTYRFGAHTLGASAFYHRRKEKIPNITTVQTDPNLKYYTFTGMENANGVTGGYSGFVREFVNHEFGGETSYAFETDGFRSLNTLSFAKGHEDTWGDMKYSPGVYRTTTYGVRSQNLILTGEQVHRIDLQVDRREGKADEFRQELVTEKNPETGIESSRWNTLLTYNSRYTVSLTDARLHYRWSLTEKDKQQEIAYAGGSMTYRSAEDKYNLPLSSLTVRTADVTAEGGISFLRGKAGRSLRMEAEAGYSASLTADLSLADATTDYATHVLLPDMNYYEASYFHAALNVQYQMPVKIKKYTNMWFVKASSQYLKTNKQTDGHFIGLSVGVYH